MQTYIIIYLIGSIIYGNCTIIGAIDAFDKTRDGSASAFIVYLFIINIAFPIYLLLQLIGKAYLFIKKLRR